MEKKDDITSLHGPIEKIDGKLTLMVPLWAGGDQFIQCSQGISEIDGEYLKITIPDWMAEKMGFKEGSRVCITNEDGNLNIVADDEEIETAAPPTNRIPFNESWCPPNPTIFHHFATYISARKFIRIAGPSYSRRH